MDISFFRPRIPGPEIILEDAVTNNIEQLAPTTDLPYWIACSPRIGAGMPDVVLACYEPQVHLLSEKGFSQIQLLAFLRAVKSVQLSMIMSHFKYSEKLLTTYLDELIDINVVERCNDSFCLSSLWRNIIPTIITVEVKVNDWRKAISQAARNRLFSHQSYVAFPKRLADRIKGNPIFTNRGIGLLSIEDDFVCEEISAKPTQPQIWEYYYKVAILLANYKQEC